MDSIDNKSPWAKLMAWWRTGGEPLDELVMQVTDHRTTTLHVLVYIMHLLWAFFSFAGGQSWSPGRGPSWDVRNQVPAGPTHALPAWEITPVFCAIREYVLRQCHVVLLDLCHSFVGLWLKDSQGRAKWEPAKWPVYGQMVRTNNDAEGWHRRLNARACHAKLNFYRLIELLHHDARLLPVQVNMETKLIIIFLHTISIIDSSNPFIIAWRLMG